MPVSINLQRGGSVNNRPQTIAQRFGFQDPDLSSPKHDKLIIWLDREMTTIVDEILERPDRKYYANQYSTFPLSPKELEKYDITNIGEYPDRDEEKLQIKKVWEYPILNGSYTVGFCDMCVRAAAVWKGKDIVFNYNNRIEKADDVHYEASFYFEVKPTIPSLGELIRQIRMYQNYTQEGKWFVVSPDTRFKSLIEAQGIGFIEAPDPDSL